MFVRYSPGDGTEMRPTNGLRADQPGVDGQEPLKRINDAGVIDWIGNLTPTLLLSIRTFLRGTLRHRKARRTKASISRSWDFPSPCRASSRMGPISGATSFPGNQSLRRYRSSSISNTFTLHGIPSSFQKAFGELLRRGRWPPSGGGLLAVVCGGRGGLQADCRDIQQVELAAGRKCIKSAATNRDQRHSANSRPGHQRTFMEETACGHLPLI